MSELPPNKRAKLLLECETLVGDKVCSFVKVRDILDSSVSAVVLYRKLLDVARSLDIPSEKQAQLQHGIATDTVTHPEALYQILESWREKVSNQATLHSLLLALEQNGLKDCAVTLQTRISVGKKIVLFQGHHVRVEDIYHDATGNIDEELLTQLVRDEVPELVNNQVPDKLGCYIQRKVMNRNRLKLQVLEGRHNDVFLIEGMQKYELTKLVGKNATTDVSGNQILQLTVRFIHLQHHGDFDRISKLASKPVHWIKYQDKHFVWIKSSGSVEALQEYVEKEQDSFDEDNLVSNKEKVVVISDSPGMGKTILLHSIAHELMKQTSTLLVRFIVLKELVQTFEGKEIDAESLVELIAEQSSKYQCGRKLVIHSLKTSDCMLMFDGFDEVLPNQIHSAEQILQAAVTLKSAHVFVTTRPHRREALENIMHVLGLTIQPFDKSNQTKFLMKFWSIEGAKRNESLQQFSTACLDTLNAKMTDFEREIAGIPLQCRLLAEVYTDHAIRCSEIGYETHKDSVDMAVITSMFDMYDSHMKMRFEKIREYEQDSSNQFELVKQVHMYYALHSLFPGHLDQLQLSEESKSISSEHLFSLGIVEATHSGLFRFVHRTFAEYLVAWAAVEVTVISREFILSQIFSNKPNQLNWIQNFIARKQQSENPFENLKEIKSFEFNFPVICYFINGFAQKQTKKKSSVIVSSIINSNLYNQVAPIFTALAYHDHPYIPYFVASCFGEDIKKKTQNNNIGDLLLVTAKHSGVELMKTFCSEVDVHSIKFLITETYDVSFPFMMTPLHVAVKRGHYQMVEFIINKFEGHYRNLQYLIHFCVHNSVEDSKSTLNDKKEIIRLLMMKNKLWGDEPLADNSTPFLQPNISFELVECLIQEGADVNVRDEENNNLLHRVVEMGDSLEGSILTINSKSYHKMLQDLLQRDFQHFNTANNENKTPLLCAIQNSELLEESVRIFRSVGADFNAVDKEGDSLLFYAIRGERSLKLIRQLIELGANWMHTNLNGQGVLHICALDGNDQALQFFLENFKMNINAEDTSSCTPLHYAVVGRSGNYKSTQMLLINKGAEVTARNQMNMTPFDKAFAKGEGLSPDVIQAMENRGLQISKQLASKALTQLLLIEELFPLDFDKDYPNILEYLIGKGGEADFQFTKNLWQWEGVRKEIIPDIIKFTTIRSSFLEKAKSCGLLEGRLKKGETFYDVVKEKAGSFERVVMILVADKQHEALVDLEDCIEEVGKKLQSIIFKRLPSGVDEFINSDYLRVMVLLTNNVNLSIKRIQDVVSQNVTVVEENDLTHQTQEDWIIVKCEILTDELFSRLVRMKSRVLCLCNSVTRKTGKYERDTFTWKDISTFYVDKIWFRHQGSLYNIEQLFGSPEKVIGTIWNIPKDFTTTSFFEINKFTIGHQIGSPNDSTYLSATIFHYFIPDKLLFMGINLEALREHAKYGQASGSFGEDIHKLDYMIIENTTQFGEVCRSTTSNIHLIEYHEGQFKLLQTKGSDKHVRRFLEEKMLCRDFPSCNCSSEALFFNLSLRLEEDEGEMLSCCVNVTEIQPFMLQILDMQASLEFYEIKKLDHYLREQRFTLNLETSNKPPFSKQIIQAVEDIVQHLEFSIDERKILQRVAVNTVFPEMNADIDSNTMNRFVEKGLLEKKDGSLVFENHTIAWYFIAELVFNDNQLDYTYVDEIRKSLFSDCFQPHRVQTSHKWWEDSVCSSDKIKTLRFANDMLFKFIEFHLRDNANLNWLKSRLIPKPISKNFLSLPGVSTNEDLLQTENKLENIIHTKWVPACVFGNHIKLLNIIFELADHSQTLVSKHIVVLAVMYSEVETIELVSQAYLRKTNEKLQDITLELRNDKTGDSNTVTLLHIAALRGNVAIFQYLLNNFGFQQLLCKPILNNILHFCVIDTLKCEQEVVERKQMIECVLDIQSNLINETYLHVTPLLAPNINIGLLMHLINLGADVFASDASSQNILHLSAYYFTPEEYDQFVQYIYKSGYSKLLHSKSDDNSSPLHTAVKYLEILDTTIELFSSANIDLNATDNYKNTALMQAMVSNRSAHLLHSLILAGADADVKEYDELYSTPLHLAAENGNLSGVRYFISRGVNVNSTNPNGNTPLHLALASPNLLTHEIVQVLFEHGADVNAIALNEFTPLTYAMRTIYEGEEKIEDRTVEFLNECGAEEFSAFKNVNSRLRKLQMEIIAGNMEKLVDTTTCSKIFLDKLLNGGTLPKNEVEELNTETDGKKQTAMLYSILLRRNPDINEFMTSLLETNQTEPFNLIMTETLNSDQVKSLLRDAVINMDYDAVVHLLKAQRLSILFFDPFFASIIHDCMDTFEYMGPLLDDKLRIINFLLGINQGLVNSRNEKKRTPLHQAILSHVHIQLNLIRLLIDYKADVNARDSKDEPPLHYSVTQEPLPPNVLEIIKLLIENGADPDAVDKGGRTFLHCAPKTFTPELYHQLIEYFDSTSRIKSLKMASSQNSTHLHFAVWELEPLICTLEVFKKCGLDFNGIDKHGNSLLYYAIGGGRSTSFLNTLISFGTDWKIPNKNLENLLHFAAECTNLDALKMFISLGCDVNASNLQGCTPLHKAISAKQINFEITNNLTKHDADGNAKNNHENCKHPDSLTPLHQGLINHSEKQLELIRLLIEFKADVNARDSKHYTPLHYAVAQTPLPRNMIEIIKFLIENGADPDAVDKGGRTFLHCAPKTFTPELYHQLIEYFDSSKKTKSLKMATSDNLTHLHCSIKGLEPLKSTLHIFKKHGLDFNEVDEEGNSVLFHAIGGGRSVFFLNTLISFGTDWRIRNKDHENILHCVAHVSNLTALKMFISLGCDVNASSLQGYTPLHWAVAGKNINLEVVKELIKHGADVNAKNKNKSSRELDNRTPLHQALLNHSEKQLELVGLLIDNMADVNSRDSEDDTPLHIAVMQEPLPRNMIELIKLLIENGADPDAVDKSGRTFLQWAPQFFTPELYHQLIEYFDSTSRISSLKMTDNHNFTHLHFAVNTPNFEPFHSTLQTFKKHDLDFNARDNDGDSVVYNAIGGGKTAEFLQTLCTFGADWTISNKKLETPLHVAAYFGNLSALKLFISFGFDVNAKNINGQIPLHNAFLGKMYGKEIRTDHEVVYELLEHGAGVNAKDNQGKLPIDLAKEQAKIGKVEEITVKLLEVFST